MSHTTPQHPFSAKPVSSPLPPPKQSSQQEREYLRPDEVNALIRAAKKVGRHGVRDAAIILLMFRHGLRTAELVALKWSQIDLVGGYIEVRRAKHGRDSIHPLRSPELRALRQIQRDYPDTQYVFVSERKAPLSTRSIRHILARAGELARIPFQVHPHQLRHACGYYERLSRSRYQGDSRLFRS
jgi:integrase